LIEARLLEERPEGRAGLLDFVQVKITARQILVCQEILCAIEVEAIFEHVLRRGLLVQIVAYTARHHLQSWIVQIEFVRGVEVVVRQCR